MIKRAILFILLTSVLCVQAQSVEKEKKSNVIGHDDAGAILFNVGLGANNLERLPFYFNTEFFVIDEISFGFQLTTGGYKFTQNNWVYKNSNLGVGGLVNYHINKLLNISYKWDFYLGGTAGYNAGYILPDDWNAPDVTLPSNNGLYYMGQVGARYYIWERLALNAEGYYGNLKSGGNYGLTFRLFN